MRPSAKADAAAAESTVTAGWVEDIRGPAPSPSRWRAAAFFRSRLEAEQDRWFLWLPVAFAVGIALYFNAPFEPGLLAALGATVIAGLVRAMARNRFLTLLAANAVLAAALGFTVARIRTEVVRAPVLERQIGPVEVSGWLELVEPRPGRGQRLTIWPVSIEGLAVQTLPRRVRLRSNQTFSDLRPGQFLRLRATMGPPASPAFPGDFDFARLAFFQQLGGVGAASGRIAILEPVQPPPAALRWRASVERLRQVIGSRITAALPGETGAIANALITGERGAISEATNQAYRDSGLFHILSISGLHMVIMAGAVFYSTRLLLACIPALALRQPIKSWAAVAAIAGAAGYLVISGSAFATVRSAIMITIMFLAVIADRPALALRNVALAALVILSLYPESLFDAGFQMSFAAVVALISAYEALRRRREARAIEVPRSGALGRVVHFVGEIMATTLIAGLAVAPFGVYHFHNTQLLAFVANVIAIPVCNLVVMPAALATLIAMPLGLEAPALWVMGLGIDAMSASARFVAQLPGAVVHVPTISDLSFAALVAGGFWLTLWETSWRILGLALVTAGLVTAPIVSRPDILISRDARIVAVRGSDGTLSAIGGGERSFDLGRWLEAEADRRRPEDAAAAHLFACDPSGCTARVKGLRVAVAHAPGALRDDCTRSDILIAQFRIARDCLPPPAGPRLRLDLRSVEAGGSHAVTIDRQGRIVVVTTARYRGNRPWSRFPAEDPSLDGAATASELP